MMDLMEALEYTLGLPSDPSFLLGRYLLNLHIS
jgi:hypothetical protein